MGGDPSESNCSSAAVSNTGRFVRPSSQIQLPTEFGIEDQVEIFNLEIQREFGPAYTRKGEGHNLVSPSEKIYIGLAAINR